MIERNSIMIEVESIEEHSGKTTVTLGRGRQIGTPLRVTFAGEPRLMEAMRMALAESANYPDSIVAVVEPWQIVGSDN